MSPSKLPPGSRDTGGVHPRLWLWPLTPMVYQSDSSVLWAPIANKYESQVLFLIIRDKKSRIRWLDFRGLFPATFPKTTSRARMTSEGVEGAAGGKVCTGMQRAPEARSAQAKGATEAKAGPEHWHLGSRNLVVILGRGGQ